MIYNTACKLTASNNYYIIGYTKGTVQKNRTLQSCLKRNTQCIQVSYLLTIRLVKLLICLSFIKAGRGGEGPPVDGPLQVQTPNLPVLIQKQTTHELSLVVHLPQIHYVLFRYSHHIA